MVEGSKDQSVESKHQLAMIVPKAIDEALLEELADPQAVIGGAASAVPVLHAFGVIDDPSTELPPDDEGPKDESPQPERS